MAKYKVGLTTFTPLDETKITEGLHTLEDDLLTEELFENALTIGQNKENILPLKDLDKRKIAYVKFGNDSGWTFYSSLRKYAEVHSYRTSKRNSTLQRNREFRYDYHRFAQTRQNSLGRL